MWSVVMMVSAVWNVLIGWLQQVESKLMGVHSDDQSGLVYIIRKSMLTYLRPGDILEHLYMGHYKILTPEFLDGVDFAVDGLLAGLLFPVLTFCTMHLVLMSCMSMVGMVTSAESSVMIV